VATFELDGEPHAGAVLRHTLVCGVDDEDDTTPRLKRIARALIAHDDLTMAVGEVRPHIERVR
jgi:hypothetical protein